MPRRNAITIYDVIPKIKLPNMKFGIWTIEKFTVSKDDAYHFNLRQWQNGVSERGIVAGTYTRLVFTDERGDKYVMMSDTPAEVRDHLPAVMHNEPGMTWIVMGFGLGMLVNALLKGGAGHVLVLENDEGIIDNVVPIYEKKYGDRLTVLHADALKWKPPKGMKWDAAWHDIWPDISEDNLAEMAILKRRYARRVKWQGAWGQELARKMRSGKLDRERPFMPAFLLDTWMRDRIVKSIEESVLYIG